MGPNANNWERYGRALHRAMADVLDEFPEAVVFYESAEDVATRARPVFPAHKAHWA
jgi:hypothetical protein